MEEAPGDCPDPSSSLSQIQQQLSFTGSAEQYGTRRIPTPRTSIQAESRRPKRATRSVLNGEGRNRRYLKRQRTRYAEQIGASSSHSLLWKRDCSQSSNVWEMEPLMTVFCERAIADQKNRRRRRLTRPNNGSSGQMWRAPGGNCLEISI